MTKFRLSLCLAALAVASSPVHAAQAKLTAAVQVSDALYGAVVPLMLGVGF